MSLETEVARLANVAEKGFADLEKGNYQAEMCGVLGEIASLLTELVKIQRLSVSPDAIFPEREKPKPAEKGVTGFTPVDLSPASVSAPTPAPAPAPVAAPNGRAKGPSYDEVVAIAQQVATVKTAPVAIKLINQHGAQKLIEMDPAKYPAFYAAAQVLLADAL